MDRSAYRQGIDALLELQKVFSVRKRPGRGMITKLVERLVKQSGLRKDPRERYFRLLCTSALLNREPMYSNWNRKKTKKRSKR